MTTAQRDAVYRANEKLKEARELLDDAMYHMGGMSDDEYINLRDVYNKICSAQDLL